VGLRVALDFVEKRIILSLPRFEPQPLNLLPIVMPSEVLKGTKNLTAIKQSKLILQENHIPIIT
jgi:hypothetical protein